MLLKKISNFGNFLVVLGFKFDLNAHKFVCGFRLVNFFSGHENPGSQLGVLLPFPFLKRCDLVFSSQEVLSSQNVVHQRLVRSGGESRHPGGTIHDLG